VDSLPRDDSDGCASLSTGIGSRLRKYLQQKQVLVTFNFDNPRVRLTLIEPSPYDDVTRDPLIPCGMNAVLLKYSAFLAQLAHDRS
jgi:hypothetical protein